MLYAILGLESILGLIYLAFVFMVIFKMFQNNDSTMGIICLVLIVVCGTGFLATFVMGWVNSARYGIKNIMLAWTGVIGLLIILEIARNVVS